MIKPVTFEICLECKKHQKNCCTDSPRVPLSIEDVKRITSLGYKLEDFVIPGEYKKESVKDDESWWKNSFIEVNDKIYKINTKKINGCCFFLKDNVGCMLGVNRPDICKIYPFWVDEENKLIWESGEKEFCYFGNYSLTKGLELIGEDKDKIKAYFSRIKEDCINNKNEHKKILLNLLK